jgi:hypothetical protein
MQKQLSASMTDPLPLTEAVRTHTLGWFYCNHEKIILVSQKIQGIIARKKKMQLKVYLHTYSKNFCNKYTSGTKVSCPVL